MSPNNADKRPAALILGCEDTALSAAERAFFRSTDPFGLILFARNIASPEGVKALIRDFRETVGRPDAPVLIDQEGGRVARLRPPHWPALPSQGAIGRLYQTAPDEACAAARLLGRALAAVVSPIGVDVACAPVADVRGPGAHQVIVGDRSFSDDPTIVAILTAEVQTALLGAGVATTPKHAPGHGRAALDSHETLPVVDLNPSALAEDLLPFKALTDAPFWMTAHIRYLAIDADRPATCSPDCLTWLRAETGYEGMLLTDDLAMGALQGDVGARTKAAMNAGCDIALYCPGDIAGGEAAAASAGFANDRSLAVWNGWVRQRAGRREPADAFALAARLWAMLEPANL